MFIAHMPAGFLLTRYLLKNERDEPDYIKYLLIGLIAMLNVIYKIATCLNCDERILGFEIPGIVYLAIWSVVAASSCIGFYKANWVETKE